VSIVQGSIFFFGNLFLRLLLSTRVASYYIRIIQARPIALVLLIEFNISQQQQQQILFARNKQHNKEN